MDGISADLTAFILAGGKSSRMGADKAFVTLDDRTLLSRALELAHALTADVRIVGDPAKFARFAPVVADVFPGCGPLGGIHAALRASQTDLNLILAVDVPFVSTELLQYLIRRARTTAAATVTVVRAVEAGSLYVPSTAENSPTQQRKALAAGRYKIDPLFATQRTLVITEDELRSAGFSPNMFRNLNTQEELAEANAEVASQVAITSEARSLEPSRSQQQSRPTAPNPRPTSNSKKSPKPSATMSCSIA